MTTINYKNQNYKIEIIYEDNQILVVQKPVGMLSQEDETGDVDLLNLLKEYIRVKYNKPGEAWLGLVHRLDRPVGGLMVFARTSKAASRLSEQIRKHTLIKKYVAVAHGKIEPASATWKDHISKHKIKGKYLADPKLDPRYAEKYQNCELSYKVLAYDKKQDLTYLEVDLKTGRSHQIRAQMKAHGHPLIGDRLYGKITDADRMAEGPALYAGFLQLEHPTKKEVMVFKKAPADYPFNLFK